MIEAEVTEVVKGGLVVDVGQRGFVPASLISTDFIEDFVEDERLAVQLRPIFNEQAPWDQEGVYRMDTIEVYFEADATKCLDKKEEPKNSNTEETHSRSGRRL